MDPLKGAEPWETMTGGHAVEAAQKKSHPPRKDTQSPQVVAVFSSKLKPSQAIREVPDTRDLKAATELVPSPAPTPTRTSTPTPTPTPPSPGYGADPGPAPSSSLGFSHAGDTPLIERTPTYTHAHSLNEAAHAVNDSEGIDFLTIEEITLETPVAEKFRAEHLVDHPSSVVVPMTPAAEKLEREADGMVSDKDTFNTIEDVPSGSEDESTPASKQTFKTGEQDDLHNPASSSTRHRKHYAVPTVSPPLHSSVTAKTIHEKTGTVEATVESDVQIGTNTGKQPSVVLHFIADEVASDPRHPDMALDGSKISKPVNAASLETQHQHKDSKDEDDRRSRQNGSSNPQLAASYTQDPTALQEAIKAAAAAGATKESIHEIEVPGAESKSKPEGSTGAWP
jgi:Tfp pilus assembly major pilin PilA